jgi:HD-GYP domain-containing protein (c-di-GMP phosphodiesterase class II)
MEEEKFSELQRNTRALSLALELRDESTRRHSDRVEGLAASLALSCGLSPAEQELLGVAAAFHDVGKIGIRDDVLMKPASLDADEWQEMRQHCEMGERMIAATGIDGALQVARIIRHHHEHYDGSGYPDGLAAEAIPLESRIISIADAYDAMSVTRAYHRPRLHSEIMTILHDETGRKYDPGLMASFCAFIEDSEYRVAPA